MNEKAPPNLRASSSALLASYRKERGMPAAAKARVEAALAEPVAARSPWIWAAVGGVAAALLLIGIGAVGGIKGTGLSATDDAAPVQAPAKALPAEAKEFGQAMPRTHSSAAPSHQGAVVEPLFVPGEPQSVVDSEVRKPQSARTVAREAKKASPAPTPAVERAPTPSTLGEENRLISRAWSEVAAGDFAGASAAVGEHRRRFADGVLAPERRAIGVIVSCSTKAKDAEAGAEAFLLAHPRSPLAKKVRTACKKK